MSAGVSSAPRGIGGRTSGMELRQIRDHGGKVVTADQS